MRPGCLVGRVEGRILFIPWSRKNSVFRNPAGFDITCQLPQSKTNNSPGPRLWNMCFFRGISFSVVYFIATDREGGEHRHPSGFRFCGTRILYHTVDANFGSCSSSFIVDEGWGLGRAFYHCNNDGGTQTQNAKIRTEPYYFALSQSNHILYR
jgi:hypothetical protein